MKSEERAASGFGPGLGALMRTKLASAFVGRGKKQSGRTPMEPKRAPAHHLHRWRDEGRSQLVLAGIRLGLLDSSRPAVGPRFGPFAGQFRTWKALAVAVERARRIKAEDVGM